MTSRWLIQGYASLPRRIIEYRGSDKGLPRKLKEMLPRKKFQDVRTPRGPFGVTCNVSAVFVLMSVMVTTNHV